MARITPFDLGVDPDGLDQGTRVQLGVTDDLHAAFQRPYDEHATPWKTAAPLIVR